MGGWLLIGAVLCLVGCGGGNAATRSTTPPPPNPLAGQVADADDLEGQVRVYETKLSKLSLDDEMYAPTLERLALAHLELADDLAARGDEAASLAARKAATVRFDELTGAFPAYEGTPSALLLVYGEHLTLGDAAAAETALTRLVERHPSSPYAIQARILLADTAYQAQQWEVATGHYEAAREALAANPLPANKDPGYAFYAGYRLATIAVDTDQAELALERLAALMATPDLPDVAIERLRSDAVAAARKLPDGTDVRAALEPFAGGDTATLDALVQQATEAR